MIQYQGEFLRSDFRSEKSNLPFMSIWHLQIISLLSWLMVIFCKVNLWARGPTAKVHSPLWRLKQLGIPLLLSSPLDGDPSPIKWRHILSPLFTSQSPGFVPCCPLTEPNPWLISAQIMNQIIDLGKEKDLGEIMHIYTCRSLLFF